MAKERKSSGTSLAELREAMAACAGEGVARFSPGGVVLYLDAAMSKLLGLDPLLHPPEQAVGQPLARLLGVPDPFQALWGEVERHGTVRAAEFTLQPAGGEVSWLLVDACRRSRPAAREGEVWVRARSLAEYGEARARLLESEKRYRDITEAISDYVFTVRIENGRPAGTVHGPMCFNVTGYTPKEFESDPYLWIRMVPHEDHDIVRRQAEAILAGEDAPPFEHRIVRKDGAIRWVMNTSVAHHAADGRLIAYDGVLRDITARKQLEETLRASEERFRLLVEHASDALFLHNHDGVILDVNQQACESLGYAREELLDLPFAAVETRLGLPELRQHWAEAESGKPVLLQGAQRRKDGSVFPVEVRVSEFESGARRMYLSQARDITARIRAEEHRKELEARLQQAEKLESLGALAGGIAHDFNNLLMCILGHAELASGSLDPEAQAQSNLEEIARASKRAAELCQQMLAYSGKGRLAIRRLDLSGIVRETCERVTASLPRNITLECDPGTPSPAGADGEQFRQVIRSLLSNAIEAIGEQPGRIRVRLDAHHCTRDELDTAILGQELSEGPYVVLEIEDSGCGMDAETLDHIFDPFFTTKFMGRGLGLAAVLGIVHGHNGAIRVQSHPGAGSVFTVFLPCENTSSRTQP